MIVRVALALVAVSLLTWLGVMERDARLVSQALNDRNVTARADGLRRARLLNPDSRPDLERALLYLGQGDRSRAAVTVERVLRREPDNLTAWGELLLIARVDDPPTAARARAALQRLDPIGARRAGSG